MKKRRALALLLCLVLLLCNPISVAAVEPACPENVESTPMAEPSTVDLSGADIAQAYTDGWNITTTDNPIITEIDFSKSTSIDLSYENTQDTEGESEFSADDDTMPLTDNQNPVASPILEILNYDSLKPDGSFTTETEFILLTRWEGEDLVYDPDGDECYLLWNDSFPDGFIKGYAEDSHGAWAGYLIHLFNVGSYPFAFAFLDSNGGASQIISFVFDVVPRGDFEIIEGALSSSTDSKTYEITVDYSKSYEYHVGLLRTGTSGFSVQIFDPDGNKVSSAACSGPSSDQSVRQYISLKQPTGVTGEYTYTIKVNPPSAQSYVEGDLRYRIAYGKASEAEYFFEGATNAMDLPYYHLVRSFDQIEPQFGSQIEASEYGDYYRIDTIGTETVTLVSTYGQYRFKVLDCENYTTLYDGGDLEAFKHDINFMNLYSTRADINFAKGGSYYLVVYKIGNADPAGGYDLTVGEPVVIYSNFTYEIPSKRVTKGQFTEWIFELETPTGRGGYVDYVNYSASGAGWPYEGGHYSILTPGASDWVQNPSKYAKWIQFNFRDPNTQLRPAAGFWRFGFTAGESGVFPGKTLQIFYAYEV